MADTIIRRNNLFGNGDEGADLNCGILNDSGVPIVAPSNFFGSPAGPGPDPADHVCRGHPRDMAGSESEEKRKAAAEEERWPVVALRRHLAAEAERGVA